MGPRVGIVGYGDIAQFHIRHLRAAGARVVGAVTRRQTEAGIVRYGLLAAMLADVDAITIAVPNHLHATLCLEAVKAGKAVFVEKPLCLKQSELDALEAVLSSTSVPIRVGFRLRWNPSLRALRQRLHNVRHVRCMYRLGIERLAAGKPWTRRAEESGGSFLTLGVHALDLARWLADAQAQPLLHLEAEEQYRDSSADFPLAASLRGTLPNGVRVEAGADLCGDDPFRLELQINAEGSYYPDPSLPRPMPEEEGAAEAEYSGLMAEFVQATCTGDARPQEVAEALQCHRDLIAARALAAQRIL